MDMPQRPRRNRKNPVLRNLLAETQLKVENLVWPVFIQLKSDSREPIVTLPGQFRWGISAAIEAMKQAEKLGIRAFAVFPVIEESDKNNTASKAVDPSHPYLQMLRRLREALPNSLLISDVALDPFSSDGHDGLVQNGKVVNDATVEILSEMALLQANCGVDFVAPSDMMDGRVGAIRSALDRKGFSDTGILAYTAKYASSFYGPFRDALSSAPRFGDKLTYQMDPRNQREALRELSADESEGADIVMVKPALAYLDVISLLKKEAKVPVAAYNVSGEYAMVKFAAQAGALDEKKAVTEILTSIRRAGADLIFTYHALDFAEWLSKN